MPRPDRNPWTPTQLAQLREMREHGCSFEEIAMRMDHTLGSCRNKAYTLGIQPPEHMRRGYRRATSERVLAGHRKPATAQTKKGMRPCLCCRNDFASQGPHNRLCKNCRRQDNDTVFTVPAMVMR